MSPARVPRWMILGDLTCEKYCAVGFVDTETYGEYILTLHTDSGRFWETRTEVERACLPVRDASAADAVDCWEHGVCDHQGAIVQ